MKRQQKNLSRALGLEGASPPLVVAGIAMTGIGIVVPGTHSQSATVLMVLGCGTFVGGVFFGQFRELDIGPSGIKITQDRGAVPLPWLSAEADTLNRVALLMLDDPELASNSVEETLTKVGRYRREIPAAQRDATTFRTLVAVLDRADQRRQREEIAPAENPLNPAQALQHVPFTARIAYVLRQEMPLREVATVLERDEDKIDSEIESVRNAYKRYLHGSGKSA